MKHIENELKKRFSNQELANDNFDTDGLWDSISNELDTIPPPSNGFSGFQKWIAGSGFLLLLVVLLGFVYFKSNNYIIIKKTDSRYKAILQNQQNETTTALLNADENITDYTEKNTDTTGTIKTTAQQNYIKKHQAVKTANTPSTSSANPHSHQKNKVVKHQYLKENTKAQPANSLTELNTFNKEPISLTDLTTEAVSTLTDESGSTSTALKNHSGTSATSIPNNSNTPANKILDTAATAEILNKNTKVSKQVTLVDNTGKTSVALLQPKISLLKPFNQSILSTASYIKIIEDKTNENPSIRLNIGFIGGINMLYRKHKANIFSQLANLKNATTKLDAGGSFGIQTTIVFNNRWLLKSGIEYHQLWSTLDYSEMKPIQILKKNELVKIAVDAETGNVINRFYKDTLVNATSTRTVLHHNKFEQISVPFEVGVQQNRNLLNYSITVGTVFNFIKNQTGKTIDADGEIIVFSKNDDEALFKPFSVGLRISPLLGYQFSENLSLTLLPKWTWSRQPNWDVTDIKTNVHQLNFNVGLKYTFK